MYLNFLTQVKERDGLKKVLFLKDMFFGGEIQLGPGAKVFNLTDSPDFFFKMYFLSIDDMRPRDRFL